MRYRRTSNRGGAGEDYNDGTGDGGGGRWRLALRLAVPLLLLWLGASAWILMGAKSDLLAGRGALESLADVDPASSDLDALRAELATAAEDVASGRARLESPILWPIRPLPVVGRQLASARALAVIADTVIEDTLSVIDLAIEVAETEAPGRVEALGRLGDGLDRLSATLGERDLGPEENLLGRLADARASAEDNLGGLASDVGDATVVVRGLESFLSDGHYLILGANVNEMQAGGGTPLTFGEVQMTDGGFRVSDVRTILEAPLEGPTDLVDPDIGELWGFLTPTNDFKKIMLTHRFRDYSAPQALVMYSAAKGRDLEGVILVDSVALRGMLTVVGPVEVDGLTFDADNVMDYVLRDQYAEFLTSDEIDPDDLSTLNPLQEARYDRLAGLAAAVFGRLAEGDWEPIELIRGLEPIGRGRHILAYSQDPVEQAMWERMGVAGVPDERGIGVSLLNLGANKLDPYMEVGLEGNSSTNPDGTVHLSLRITVDNQTPEGLPDVVNGYYWETLGLATPRTYLGRIMLRLPESTVSIELDEESESELEVFGPDGNGVVAVTRVMIVDGESRVVTAEIDLDTTVDEFVLIPSARYPAVPVLWNGHELEDSGPAELLSAN